MSERSRSPHHHGQSEVALRPEIVRAVEEAKAGVGANVRALRGERGWNQEETAALAGIHPKYLSRLETGAANPTLAVLVGLALAFEVPLASLVGG